MYGVADYGRMLADRVRVDAYTRALAAVIRPSSVVVDLGAGTGVFALVACQLGARKVYAIEPNDAVTLLPALARRNGFGDRIAIIQRPSTEVALPEKADVIVADLRGVVPLYEGNFPVVADARARFLAEGGVVIPAQDRLAAALMEAPELYQSIVGGWEGLSLDLAEARASVVNAFHNDRRHPLTREQLLSEPGTWATLVYGTLPPELVTGTVEHEATRDGLAHGVGVWFDTTLHGDIGYSGAPSEDRVYGRAFLPLERPVAVRRGDRVRITLSARRGADDHLWMWALRIDRGDVVVTETRQSTFLGDAVRASTITKESTAHQPVAGARGRAVSAMLAAMGGSKTLGAIASEVHAAHPGAFASPEEALHTMRRLVRKYA